MRIIILITLLTFSSSLYSQITSKQNGDWNSTATWNGGVVPTSSDDVEISSAHSVTVTSNASCTRLTIYGNSTTTTFTVNNGITFSPARFDIWPNGNSQTINVINNGEVIISSLLYVFDQGNTNFTCNLSGSGSYDITGRSQFNSIANGGVLTTNISQKMRVVGEVYLHNFKSTGNTVVNITDSLELESKIVLHDASGASSDNVLLNISHSNAVLYLNGNITWRFIGAGGEISNASSLGLTILNSISNYNTDSRLNFGRIAIEGSHTLSSNFELANNEILELISGSTISSNGNDISLTGSLDNNGTLTMTSGDKLTFNGSSAQTFSGSGTSTVGELVLNNDAGLTISTTNDVEVSTQVILTDGSLATGGKLKLLNTGSGMANLGEIPSGHTVTGNITCQFNSGSLTNSGYRQMSMPVSSIQMSDIQYHTTNQPNGIETWGFSGANSKPTSTNSSSYTFDASAANAAGNFDDGWAKFTASSQTIDYTTGTSHYTGPVSAGGKGTYSFEVVGAPNTGSLTVNSGFAFDGSKTGTLPPINLNYNWAFVGNPYPSTISWASVLAASSDIEGNAYIFQQDGSGWTATTNIPPFQGFFVRADGGSPSVVFNESAKVTTKSAFLKSINENDYIEMFISSTIAPTHYSYAKLAFNSNYSENYDSDEDAFRVKNPSPWSNIAIVANNGTPLQINKVPNNNGHRTYPINTTTYQSGQHTLTFKNLENVEGCFVLLDKHENKEIVLSASNNTYSFFLSDTVVGDRFELHTYEFAQKLITNNSSCYGTNSGSVELDLLNAGSDYYLNLLDENGLNVITEFNANGKYAVNNLAPGKYTFEVSSNGIACPTTNEYFTIFEPSEMTPAFDFGTDSLLFFVNEEINFTNLSTGDILNYEWKFGDNITSNSKSPTHTYYTDGVYSVELTAKNGNNDCDVSTKRIIQVINSQVSVEKLNTNNTTIKQIENELLVSSDSEIMGYEVLDLAGKSLDNKQTKMSNSTSIDINNLNNGVYILVVNLNNSNSYTHKFYKK